MVVPKEGCPSSEVGRSSQNSCMLHHAPRCAAPAPGARRCNHAEILGVLIRLLSELAHDCPPTFLCHYYNFYFAHTAGGRMIGAKVASMILDGQELAFYKVTARVPVPAASHACSECYCHLLHCIHPCSRAPAVPLP